MNQCLWKFIFFPGLFLNIVIFTTVPCTRGRCHKGWTSTLISRSCLKLYNDRVTWWQAKSTCKAQEAKLVVIPNIEKKNFLHDFTPNELFWIGLMKMGPSDFKWVDANVKFSYTFWFNGEPDGIGAQCVMMNHKKSQKSMGNWIDMSCFANGAFICEKCEDEMSNVYGCYKNCSVNCAGENNTCDYEDGSCEMGCNAGYKGSTCAEKCEEKTFGFNCTESCSINCAGEHNTCNHVDGSCEMGCNAGFQGSTCTEKCKNQTYGINCSESCYTNCVGCNHVDGSCEMGCNAGFQGSTCTEKCENPTYGINCSESCYTNCAGCNHVDGSCEMGCNAGFQGSTCTEKCGNPTYGINCSERCNINCAGENNSCNHVDGSCEFGCDAGFTGFDCSGLKEDSVSGQLTIALSLLAGICLLMIFLIFLAPMYYESKLSEKNSELPESYPETWQDHQWALPSETNLPESPKNYYDSANTSFCEWE